jgi:hypothetical protein
MKNKKLLYILLPAVILIWGMIIYRVLNGSKSEMPATGDVLKNNTSVIGVSDDSFSLSAAYPDPFRAEPVKHSVLAAGSSVPLKQPAKEKKTLPPVNASWPQVTYNGVIKNQQSKKELAMVQVNGQSSFMKAGDVTNDVQLLKIFRDSIQVQYGKEKKIVHK